MNTDDESVLEWSTGLEGVQSYQLVDELIKRRWIYEKRPRTVLVAPREYDPQGTRRGESG